VLASERAVPKAVALVMGDMASASVRHGYAAETDAALKQQVPEARL